MMGRQFSRRRIIASLGAAGLFDITGCTNRTEQDPDSTNTEDDRVTDRPVTERPDSFVDVNGTEFTLDGSPVYYCGGHAGTPIMRTDASDPTIEYAYEDAFDGEHYVADFMQFAAAHGMDVLRVVVNSSERSGDNIIHEGPGEFNERWFEHFDRIVAEATRNSVRLIVSLLSSDRELAPGPYQYALWSDTIDESLEGRELYDAFFHDEQATRYYKNFIEHLLTRENTITGVEPRNDPTIMMWECGNEIEYASPKRSEESLGKWYGDIASYIKSLDSNHIVGTGMYGSAERNDFIADHESDAIDACSFHLYPKMGNGADLRGDPPYREDPWTDLSVTETKTHIEAKVEQAHEELGKPVYLGEYGVPQFPDIYDWDLETRNRFLEAMYETAAATDLNGMNVFALELILKHIEDARLTDGRESNGIYPDDEETLAVIEQYAGTAEEKSETSLAWDRD